MNNPNGCGWRGAADDIAAHLRDNVATITSLAERPRPTRAECYRLDVLIANLVYANTFLRHVVDWHRGCEKCARGIDRYEERHEPAEFGDSVSYVGDVISALEHLRASLPIDKNRDEVKWTSEKHIEFFSQAMDVQGELLQKAIAILERERDAI